MLSGQDIMVRKVRINTTKLIYFLGFVIIKIWCYSQNHYSLSNTDSLFLSANKNI